MGKTILNELKKLNLFGIDLTFEKDGSNRFNSTFGLVLSTMLFIATLIVGIIIGQEIYLREKPKFTVSNGNISTKDSEFNISEFPFVFAFSYRNGTPVKHENLGKILSVNVMNVNWSLKGATYNFTTLVDCDLEGITNNFSRKIISDAIKVYSNHHAYCFPNNYTIAGLAGSLDSTALVLSMTKCLKNCDPNMDDLIEGISFGMGNPNVLVDPSDYKEPLKYTIKSENFILSSKISKQYILQYSYNKLMTDKGWIFENIKTDRFISFNSIRQELYFAPNEVIKIVYESSIITQSSKREYLKIQELFATIGGFFNFFLIILGVIFSNYFKFDYHMSIAKMIEEWKLDVLQESGANMKISNFVSSHIQTNNLINTESVKNINASEQNINNNRSQSKMIVNPIRNENQKFREKVLNINNNDIFKKGALDNENDINNDKSPNEVNNNHYTDSYFVYLFGMIFCCSHYNKKMLETVENIMSIDRFIFNSLHDKIN